MLLACQLLCESAKQQAQRFITTTGKENKHLLCFWFFFFPKESQSWKTLTCGGDSRSNRGDTFEFSSPPVLRKWECFLYCDCAVL